MNSVNYIGAKTKPAVNGRSHQNSRNYLGHYQRLQKLLDAYKTRQASVEFRHNLLRKQRKHNYQLEYDRIQGLLSQSIIPDTTRKMLEDREKVLMELGAKAVNSIPD
jgi:hypothetical protein